MFEHKGYKIEITEAKGFRNYATDCLEIYEVTAGDKYFYTGTSSFGSTFALTGEECLQMQKDLIDQAIGQ